MLDSPYFRVITLTTAGYGDFSPSTTAGKNFTMFYIFIGLGIILGFVNAVAERSMEHRGGIRALQSQSSHTRRSSQPLAPWRWIEIFENPGTGW